MNQDFFRITFIDIQNGFDFQKANFINGTDQFRRKINPMGGAWCSALKDIAHFINSFNT